MQIGAHRGVSACAYAYDACTRARDCSDECHRSISRRGWNFWPSRGVREGDKEGRGESRRIRKMGGRYRGIERKNRRHTCAIDPRCSVVGAGVTTRSRFQQRPLSKDTCDWLNVGANRRLVFLETAGYRGDSVRRRLLTSS